MLIGIVASLQFSEAGTPATVARIDDLGSRLNVELPDIYRNFLLATNGGHPRFDSFTGLDDNNGGSTIDRFLSVDDADDNDAREDYAGRYPDGFIPIASCEGGDLLLLSLKTHEMYFWDHEQEADDGEAPTMRNMVLVANSIAGLLQGLFRLDIDEDGNFSEVRPTLNGTDALTTQSGAVGQ